MAEKGIVVADAASGESIATRDAFVNDDNGNPRVIQRVDVTNTRCPNPLLAVRGRTTPVSTYDPIIVDQWPGDLTNNLIDVGDGSRVVVMADMLRQTSIYVSVVFYDGQSTPNVIGISQKIHIVGDIQKTSGGRFIGRVTANNNVSCRGAHKVGILIDTIDDTETAADNNVRIYAYII